VRHVQSGQGALLSTTASQNLALVRGV
jgi:hypothetical protein